MSTSLLTRSSFSPHVPCGQVEVALEDHIYARPDTRTSPRVMSDGEHSFHPEDVGTFVAQGGAHPLLYLIQVNLTREHDAEACHRAVVGVLFARVEELWIHFQGALQVEAFDVEYAVE